jgi:F420 biosynthesis protein FbiB-like protein
MKGLVWKKTEKGWDRSEQDSIKPDVLLSNVDLSPYHAVFFPGGNGPENLLKRDSTRVVHIIQEANQKGLVVAAICHGPQVLATAQIVQGRKVTGHRETKEALVDAGGEYVNEICVVDGDLITGNWPYFETMAVQVARRLLRLPPEESGPIAVFKENPVLQTIKERRSIRRFQEKDVDSTIVDVLIQAATWAPSAQNEQPWRFVVVRNPEVKRQIVDAFVARMKGEYEAIGVPMDKMRESWENLFAAPVHIFAFAMMPEDTQDKEEYELDALCRIQGTSAACQNILLAAKAMGLGSLWHGSTLYVETEIKTLLKAPEKTRLMTTIAIGYAVEEPLPRIHKPLSKVMSWEQWGME